ncbi:ATPase, AAA-type, core domain protein [Candidatus Magnetomorum sp. HK-1]|nr:ATPase, AAA-type, core domain protein [Candidatus Magnetomorum sp. HK-1]
MSTAGTKSDQGDDYQRAVAMDWLIKLLENNEIAYIQAESNGIPGINKKVSVDDIVIVYKDNQRLYIQAKKNQTANRAWSLPDLKYELPKILNQLETDSNARVALYSQTPFGDFASLIKSSNEYPEWSLFHLQTSDNLKKTIKKLSEYWDRQEKEIFLLLRRVQIGPHHSLDEYEQINYQKLSYLVPHADLAIDVLEKFLNIHQSKIQAPKLTIHQEDIIERLESKGFFLMPKMSEAEILNQFKQISCIGRDWQRTIGDEHIKRSELDVLIEHVKSHEKLILVTDRPGSGKTCLLLDLVDYIERSSRFGLLFIKGDRFSYIQNNTDYIFKGFPQKIVALCSRLSEYRQVVVIIDSLDVLSMSRNHDTLKIFLGLIDQLSTIKEITVVAACRLFDLQYHPLLRDRKWNQKVTLGDLDYKKIVIPLLNKWGICDSKIDNNLKQLLQLPQNLKLFKSIAIRNNNLSIRNAYELHETFLNEIILKNPDLGDDAMTVLHKIVDLLLKDRSQSIPIASFPGNENIRQSLVSYGVLIQDTFNAVEFSHQTLFDTLIVHNCINQDKKIASFIKEHPPFPFLRPSVRTFVLFLRAHNPNNFVKQIWQVLSDSSIAYHFKRLIVESLSEISPGKADWPFINRLFKNYPELFRRLFWKVESSEWFRLLIDFWLPTLDLSSVNDEWNILLVIRLKRLINTHSDEVIHLWQRALTENWNDKQIPLSITTDLHDFSGWQTDGVYELLETLIHKNTSEHGMLGQVISRYVLNTDQGDKLLWQYITKNIKDSEGESHNVSNALLCEKHHFHDENFFKNRLVNSTLLLNMAISSLEKWCSQETSLHHFKTSFLYNSSWKNHHTKFDMEFADSLTILLNNIEQAIIKHAQSNSSWWKLNEPKLRFSHDVVILYFLINAYQTNPEMNISGIGSLITDKILLRFGNIDYELGKLIQQTYHILSSEIHILNQRVILDLYAEEDWGSDGPPEWVLKIRYDYLIWIPAIFRLPEVQSFIDNFIQHFFNSLPSPAIHVWGGFADRPVSSLQLINLNNKQLLCLLTYYNQYHNNRSNLSDHYTGGRDEIEPVLSDAASLHPKHFIDFVVELERHCLQP